ncbi:YggS family pyridoxal phosphate-dependent enzyme [Leptospira stimsonii]|uniref:Pyridoxal phosphate homeostasis protein n=1 Tax=Leptospira stimsonii TaxID=2202203 RepID=A0A4R9LAD5_9LEPT|nr:YggS family pyridoxal phosphate-dependent enzyme [Leptospira stimsonii]RHX84442.1 YggS family pyridoxal phosphate-dependent enzyme [Leptospira stimsonii]TGK14245.1 YggS family pyridoxal phosphate-dependent enzyme [Leptospira stimsonii]TGM22098.1 YggS family pyridoxal phosphate-dependent enzyme [Leptospira stimsonii]
MGIRERYLQIQEELASLRPEKPPTLIAVSKFQTLQAVTEAVNAGVIHFGENRIQEGLEKFEEWLKPKESPLVLHHIGPVQSGTLRKLFLGYSYAHGVGSLGTLEELLSRAQKEQKKIRYFLQVNLTNEESKHGFDKKELLEILTKKENLSNEFCILEGMMTMGPSDGEPNKTRDVFRELSKIRNEYYPEGKLSMGMSGDYRTAIEEGSDFVRIGSAIFGERN